jgi:hypothetical protein
MEKFMKKSQRIQEARGEEKERYLARKLER